MHHDQATFNSKSINEAYFNNRTFYIFCNGWIDCRDTFHAVLRFAITLGDGLKMS